MPRLYIIYWWDTEDYINPESDDALLLLLQEFKKRSMPAMFKMVGRKTRALVERRRADVIEMLSDDLFEIGYHTEGHSAHPTIAEYTEHLDWRRGVAEILARESEGLELTRRTFGKEILCYGQPGASYTPFVYGAMRSWGVPAYLGSAVYLGDYTLPSSIHGVFNIAGQRDASASFPARRGDEAPELARRHIESLMASLSEGAVISHGNHPNEWSLSEWWDEVNFARGASPLQSEWKRASLVPEPEMRRCVTLFGGYLDWISEQGIRPIGIRSAMTLFSSARTEISRSAVLNAAGAWADGNTGFYLDETGRVSLSAAQCLALLAQAVAEPRKKTFQAREVDAPAFLDGMETAAGCNIPRRELKAAAADLAAHVRSSGMLPPSVRCGGVSIPPAVFGVALARSLKNPGAGTVEVHPAETRFLPGELVREYGKTVGPWSIHHDAFTGENLRMWTKLLSWSYRRLFPEQ